MSFDDDGADRLNAFLDAQVLGRSDDPGGLDPEVIATHDRIERLAGGIPTDRELKTQVWRTMMEAFPAAQPRIAGQESLKREKMVPRHPGAARRRGRDRRAPRAIFGAVATVALVLVSALGIYLFNRPTNDAGHSAAQIAAPGTPAAQSTPTSCSLDANSDRRRMHVASALFVQEAVSKPAYNANTWQMQGWTINKGATTQFTEASTSVAFDFVLDGFYSATFGSEAEVARHWLAGGLMTAIPAGQTVELSYGDSVGFDPTKGVSLRNASQNRELRFKRAMFTVKSLAATAPLVNGASVVIDAGGFLPLKIGTLVTVKNGPLDLDFVYPTSGFPCAPPNMLQLNDPVGALPNPGFDLGGGFILVLYVGG